MHAKEPMWQSHQPIGLQPFPALSRVTNEAQERSVTCCSAWAAIIDDGGGVFLLKEGHSTLHAADGRKV
jgi:hypothetical protein